MLNTRGTEKEQAEEVEEEIKKKKEGEMREISDEVG
jgi:hypothetical protein